MSRRTQQQLVNQRFADIQNKKARKGFKWGFSDKTGWDWLQLIGILAVPLILGIATFSFSIQQANLAQQQHENDQKIANQQRLQDQALALDQQRQATLVKYQDDMRDLLLHEGLLTSKPGDEIRVIALTETLSAMSQLDVKRISFLIRFLQNAHLNGVVSASKVTYNIVNFSDADLSAIDFTNADLDNAYLHGANLFGANLGAASLHGADLSNAFLLGAYLHGADLGITNLDNAYLNGANLSNAGLIDANLSNANLDGADLFGADLRGADLSNADLGGAYLTHAQNLNQQQLDQVLTCNGAILPQGLTCHRNRNSSP